MTRTRVALATLCLFFFALIGNAQTVNLFDYTAAQSGGPYEPSGTLDSYGFQYVKVPSRGYLSVIPNFNIGANNAGNTAFIIPFFAADGTTVLGYSPSVAAYTCITAHLVQLFTAFLGTLAIRARRHPGLCLLTAAR